MGERDMEKPWESEPDVVSRDSGAYHVIAYRNPQMKHFCGYVGVRKTHPLYGKHYDDKELWETHVHGGLTFSDKARFSDVFKNKCWYFGFDCAHAGDLVPKMAEIRSKMPYEDEFVSLFSGDEYRDLHYVQSELESLVGQLKDVKDKNPNYRINHVKEYRRLRRLKG